MLEKNEIDGTALFFKGGAIGFKGRLKAHRGEWLSAANAGRKALPIVRTASEVDPENHDIQLGSGIYNYYAEIVPREYPFLKPLIIFIPPGDREKGLQQLTVASQKGKYANVEAEYFLLQIYYFYEKDYPKALSLAEDLHQRFPNNMLFHKYVGRCCVLANNWQRVNEVFTEIARLVKNGQRGYGVATEREAEYYLGTYELTHGTIDAALKHLFRCDELSRDLDSDGSIGFMAMANLKVGMAYDLQTKRDKAIAQYKRVLGMKEYQDSHRQAEQFLKVPYIR
jgi:hypothetical protein